MIESMWVWGAIGIILLAVEMATGTFYILWFGIAALILAVVVGLVPTLSYALQFVLFAVLSLTSLGIWRRYYKKTATHSRVGQSQGEEIGRTGVIIVACSPMQNGRVVFTQGLMGSREWTAVAAEELAVGVQVSVTAVEGNALRVARIV